MMRCNGVLLWKLGVDAMLLLFYDMLLGRCSVYYAVVMLVFHTVTCISELLWKFATYTATLMNHCVKMTLR